MTEIKQLNASDIRAHEFALIELLSDAVNNGASVGYLRPMDQRMARDYWNDVLHAVESGSRILLVAFDSERAVGTVQLDLCPKQNGVHRAEVTKLLVHSSVRRRGIASELMSAIEQKARHASRSLLFLDTESKSGAEPFYETQQWRRVGSIPDYALSADGVPTPNVIFCKQLQGA